MDAHFLESVVDGLALIMVGLLGWFAKSKVDGVDRRLDDLTHAVRTFVDGSHEKHAKQSTSIELLFEKVGRLEEWKDRKSWAEDTNPGTPAYRPRRRRGDDEEEGGDE